MTKDRYEQIKERNKTNKLMICYEIFCEKKKQIPYNTFTDLFPQWLITRQPDLYVMTAGDINKVTEVGLERIIEHFNKELCQKSF